MNHYHLIRPMKHGPPGSCSSIFHLFENILNNVLTSIGKNNILCRPVMVISYDDIFPQVCIGKLSISVAL